MLRNLNQTDQNIIEKIVTETSLNEVIKALARFAGERGNYFRDNDPTEVGQRNADTWDDICEIIFKAGTDIEGRVYKRAKVENKTFAELTEEVGYREIRRV